MTRNFRYALAECSVSHDQQNTKTNEKSNYFTPSPFNSHKTNPQVYETNWVSMTYVPKFTVHFAEINIYM